MEYRPKGLGPEPFQTGSGEIKGGCGQTRVEDNKNLKWLSFFGLFTLGGDNRLQPVGATAD